MLFTKKKMRIALGALAVAMVGCSAEIGGELIGVQGRGAYQPEIPPYGMVLIPQGSVQMGLNDEDFFKSMNAPTAVRSVDAFWIDQTEITNNEYRQFVYYVYDSIVRRLLGEQFEDFITSEDAVGNPIDPPLINWAMKIDRKNTDYAEIINNGLFTPSNQTASGRKELIASRLIYEYRWEDLQRKLGRKNANDTTPLVFDENGNVSLSSYLIKEAVPIYPDTLVWIRDWHLAYNEPFAFRYFSHPSYDDYPVVGINWKQATAFCFWRTKLCVEFAFKTKRVVPHEYRLPNEAEWEYAARGGHDGQKYPWGGPYTYNKEGCYLANFLPQRARHGLDGGTKTLPVGSYQPNDFGLYDMAGNVAEWTAEAFDEQAYNFVNDMNPSYRYNVTDIDPEVMRRKVIRGGSWKDVAYFLQCGARTFEFQDTTKSYIGFRCVRSYLGR
jgi:gliding motility-associated lipoprotein GldK